jgi:hypothetical protein
MTQKNTPEFNFTKPAVHKIKVLGDLSEDWSDRLGGMQINVDRSQETGPVSVLIGQINDQSAISGVLNRLYESHLTIISVTMLKDES